MTVNVNEMTFGIEFETTVPYGTCQIGSYKHGIQVPALPPGWKAERDGSIRCDVGHQACEIVSPILKGADGVKQVIAVLEWLNQVGAKVNRSTGMHVHVGWSAGEAELSNLAHYVSNFEPALYASTGTHSREVGPFCKSIKSDATYVGKFRGKQAMSVTDRYHTLNITNLSTGKQTVEFRLFAGTLNASKALGYIRLCLGIVEKSLTTKRSPLWDGKPVVATSRKFRKGGIGQTELRRLFDMLGWIAGSKKKSECYEYGNLTADGVPTIEDNKQILRKMAAKYDGGLEVETATN